MTSEGTGPGEVVYHRASDLALTPPPKYPMVVCGGRSLRVEPGREYEIPTDPIKVLGLLDHLAGKTWVTRDWLSDAIERIAAARGWDIHG